MEARIPVMFPTPLRDEPLYGLFCRYHIASGNKCIEETREQLTGQISGWPDRASSFSIDDVATRVGPALGFTTDEVINRLTLVPLHIWLGDDSSNMAFRSSRNASFGKVLPSSDPRHRLPMYEPNELKFCVRCCEEDQATFGVPRWHMVHQPQEVTVCPEHGLRLLIGCLWCGHPPSREHLELPRLTCEACGRNLTSTALESFQSTQLERDIAQIVRLLLDKAERPRASWSALNAELGLLTSIGLGDYKTIDIEEHFQAFRESEDTALIDVERSWMGGVHNLLKPPFPGLGSPRVALRGFDVKNKFFNMRRSPALDRACRLWLLVYASRQWSSDDRAINSYLRQGYITAT